MPQSILIQNISTYADQAEEKLLKFAYMYNVKKRFDIGEEVCADEWFHNSMLHGLLCTDNCELIDYIEAKIEGRVLPETCKKPITEIIKTECKQNCSITEGLEELCTWGAVEW